MGKKTGLAGAIATFLAALLLIGVFWGFEIYPRIGTTWFAPTSEDFIKDVYTTTYHAAYGKSLTQSTAMNYPYGEYHTFSGMQPLVAMPLQILRKAGIGNVEQAVLPLLNIGVLLSIVLCALFLYLLLYELKLPWWYAAISALLITLMSPQLQRMGGHLSLSYYCAIPMLLYFTLKHLKSGGWGWAAAIGVTALFFGLCHPYYLVFFAVVSLTELVYLLLTKKDNGTTWAGIILSATLQLLAPLLIFYLFTHLGLDTNGNRTAVPSGLYRYNGRLAGLLFPYGRCYFLEDSNIFNPVRWEARSYIGLTAVVMTGVLLWRLVSGLFCRKYKHRLRPTDNTGLNLMLLSAVLLVIYACGVPLQMLPRSTVNYIGPLAQIRASARLVWLFYYVIGVVTFYLIYHFSQRLRGKWGAVIIALSILVTSAEATAYNYRNKAWYLMKWEAWTDYDNQTTNNHWVEGFDATQFQAILTLPVFNVGSEFINLPSCQDMFAQSALLSIKTGLPLICNESSRSDIDQAWSCIALSRTAWQEFPLAGALPSDKPLLLAVAPDTSGLSHAELLLLSHATHLFDINGASLYTLPTSALYTVVEETQHTLRKQFEAKTDTGWILFDGPITADIHKQSILIDEPISLDGEAELSFWMSDITADMLSRSTFTVKVQVEGQWQSLYQWSIEPLINLVDAASGDGLVRITLTLPEGCERIRLEMRNPYMKHRDITYRNILLRRPETTATFTNGCDYVNNIPILYNPDYVSINKGNFYLDGEPWFPFMLNYKAFISNGEVVPAPWYTGRDVREHFDTIASWGFNAVRVCLDAMNEGGDTAAMYRATRRMVQQADSAGLRVMLLIKPPFKGYWRDYAIGLMRCLADLPALWAYDLMNEPLYFDPEPRRDKMDAVKQVREWRDMVRHYAPHQLFTVSTAEPIEVFEWDPAMLPVDFIEMHTYHPLRVQAEMWWYSHYCNKPWMVGETGLPADGDSVPYVAQVGFMWETYRYAKFHGAIGYGWWEFQDCPEGVNFEAQYTGLRDANGKRKPAADMPKYFKYVCLGFETDEDLVPPANYYNMLAYQNLAATGCVMDEKGNPIEGAVIRGWNEDWSVGMNTYTDSLGRFRLVSNDVCTHFEVSAPHYSKVKFNRTPSYPSNLQLPNKEREYQQIPLRGWGEALPIPNGGSQEMLLPTNPKQFEAPTAVEASIGEIKLKRL